MPPLRGSGLGEPGTWGSAALTPGYLMSRSALLTPNSQTSDRIERQPVTRCAGRLRTKDTSLLEAIYPKRKISVAHPEHKIFPYLLRGVEIVRPNQV